MAHSGRMVTTLQLLRLRNFVQSGEWGRLAATLAEIEAGEAQSTRVVPEEQWDRVRALVGQLADHSANVNKEPEEIVNAFIELDRLLDSLLFGR